MELGKIIVAGATGFVGRALVKRLLADGHEVVVLTRGVGAGFPRPGRGNSWIGRGNPAPTIQWDAQNPGEWCASLEGATAIINLAGEPLMAKRWTPDQKTKILTSRVQSTQALAQAVEKNFIRPKTFINASAVGFYGLAPQGEITEGSPAGEDFLADVCAQWEAAADPVSQMGVRLVKLRLGIVLGETGGAISKMVPAFKYFIGGPPGTGAQWFPWVHLEDVVEAINYILGNGKIAGAVNMTAPEMVTMKEFCRQLGKKLKRPSWLPVPPLVLRLMLGEMAEVVLGGQKAVPQKLQETGYLFKYSYLDRALGAIVSD